MYFYNLAKSDTNSTFKFNELNNRFNCIKAIGDVGDVETIFLKPVSLYIFMQFSRIGIMSAFEVDKSELSSARVKVDGTIDFTALL